jgi:two-component system CheB/CheR fusion protein
MSTLPLSGQVDFQKKADEILLSQFCPPGAIVSEQNEVIHFTGDTSFFFTLPPGKAGFNVIKMIRKELAFDLRHLLNKAKQKKERVSKQNMIIKSGKESYLVSIEVIPLVEPQSTYYLVVFPEKIPVQVEPDKSGRKPQKDTLDKQHIRQLESELSQTRQDMVSVIENQEIDNEKLHVTNVNLFSSNEELRLTNEELESSKQALKSDNKELINLNEKLINHQENLNHAHARLDELNRSLQIQNKTLEEAQVNALMGSATWNIQTDEITYSANLYRIFGFKPGRDRLDLAQIKKLIHPDDLPGLKEMKKNIFPKKKVGEFSFRIFTSGGAVKYIRGKASIMQVGSQELVVLVVQDISRDVLLNKHLQTREAILSEAQELGKIGSWEVDFRTDTIVWSEETYRMYGYEPDEIPIDNETIARVHPDDIAELKEQLEKVKKTGEKFEAEYRRYDKAGQIHYIHSRGNPRIDSEGRITGILCVSMDITELHEKKQKLKEAYAEVERKNSELERSNNELSAFSYIASHDLQEPLRKIETFIQRILQKEQVSDSMQDYFMRIVKASRRMKSLLTDLLSYSRMNAVNESFMPVDLNTVLDEAKSSLSEKIAEKNVFIEADTLPTLNVIQTQFYQLFMNLLSNAIKYSKIDIQPHIKVTVAAVRGDEIDDPRAIAKQQYWRISFEDNGIGFEQENEHKVFELFQRLHGKSEYEGTGIGLTICRKVVQNHNGFINAISSPDNGAVFNIYLPVA